MKLRRGHKANEPAPELTGADAERQARYDAREASAPTLSPEEFKLRSRRSFLTGTAAVAAGAFGFNWIQNDPRRDGTPGILRKGHELNEALWRRLYDPNRMAPEFAISESTRPRINGRWGLRHEIDLDLWTLRILGPSGEQIDELTIDDITSLPTVEQVTEHKCVEGWSEIVHWTGTPFRNLVEAHPEWPADLPYVSLRTPPPVEPMDREYYVGMDIESMMHAQTLLAWGIQGEPLTQLHGAPLRLVTPLKYGIKAIKRIATIQFTDERPDDYWGDRGYDWYSSH